MTGQHAQQYKYLATDEHDEDTEIYFSASSDTVALEYVKKQEDALETEDGPIVYRFNTPTSSFGCGYNCLGCDAWVDITEQLTMHGTPIKQNSRGEWVQA
jgi:hypothetical protein